MATANGSRSWRTPGSRSPSSTPRPATGWARKAGSTTCTPSSPRRGRGPAAGGQGSGVGALVAPRRNDCSLDVANRDLWIVTAVGRGGTLAVVPPDRPSGGTRVLLADYVTRHVELAYASTVYGAQGYTVTAAHVVVGE